MVGNLRPWTMTESELRLIAAEYPTSTAAEKAEAAGWDRSDVYTALGSMTCANNDRREWAYRRNHSVLLFDGEIVRIMRKRIAERRQSREKVA